MRRLLVGILFCLLCSKAYATTDSWALDFELDNKQRVAFTNGTGDSGKRPAVALWAKFESAGVDMCFVGGKYYGRALAFYWDYDAGGSHLTLLTNNGGTEQINPSTVAWTPDLDTWYCLAVAGGSDGTVKFWVNGVLQDTLTSKTTNVTLSTLVLNIGQFQDQGGYWMEFDGQIAGIGVWFASSGTLSDSDVATIYNGGVAACDIWNFSTGMGAPTHLFKFEEGSGTSADDVMQAADGTLTGTTGTPTWTAYTPPESGSGSIAYWNRRRH